MLYEVITSREILQDNKITAQLRKACTKRVLNMLAKLAKDDSEQYQLFWQQFGNVLKEGPAEDWAHKDDLAKLLRFASTQGSHVKSKMYLKSRENTTCVFVITSYSIHYTKLYEHRRAPDARRAAIR